MQAVQTGGATALGYRPDVWRMGTFLLCCTAAFWLFIAFGSDSDISNEPGSIFKWISIQWKHEDFRFNWVMLIFSAYAIYRNRRELAEAETKPSLLGMVVVAMSLFGHIVGYRTQLPRLSIGMTVGVYW